MEPETQWLYGRARIIDEFGHEQRQWITWYKTLRMRPFSYAKLLTEDWIPQMGVFWRRSAGEAVGPFRKGLHYALDYDYWLRLGAKWPGQYVDRCRGAFRWHSAGKTSSGYVESTREALAVAIKNANGRYRSAIWWSWGHVDWKERFVVLRKAKHEVFFLLACINLLIVGLGWAAEP